MSMGWRVVLLFWVSLSLSWAQVSVEASSDSPAAISVPPVDCAGDLNQIIEILLLGREETSGRQRQEAYLCLHARQDAGPVLMERLTLLEEDDDLRNRMSRALTIWLLGQLDRELTGPEIRAINADDLRLLREGISVRRGREPACISLDLSVSQCSQAMVFPQFEWYQPRANYHDGMLTDMDRRNQDLIDNPPVEPEPDPVVEPGSLESETPSGPEPSSCGCGSVRNMGVSYIWWILGLLYLHRRR